MAYVIAEPCHGSRDASCVEVCPVDCIHTDEGSPQYFIDPKLCINCAACVDACPVKAIYSEDNLPAHWLNYLAMNADFFATRAR
jgi:ferredoxin